MKLKIAEYNHNHPKDDYHIHAVHDLIVKYKICTKCIAISFHDDQPYDQNPVVKQKIDQFELSKQEVFYCFHAVSPIVQIFGTGILPDECS